MTRIGETLYRATSPGGQVAEFNSMQEAQWWARGLDSDGEPITE